MQDISRVGRTPNGHVDERMEGRMISPRFKLHGNREWKEAALVGPSLPLIVPPFSPFPFRQLRSFFPLVLLVSVKRPSPELSRLDLILASFSLVSRPPRTPAPRAGEPCAGGRRSRRRRRTI